VELQISAQADSWLEVVDSDRRVVWSQVLPGGESVQLSAAPPLQVVVGNVGATRLTVDGQAVDLLPHARGNVARLQLP
jgi:cytoskeleton protein RodZ